MLAASLLLTLTAQQPARCPIPAHWGIEASQPGLVASGNRITIENKGIRWNGAPVDDATFRLYLRSAARISPRPRLIIPAHDMPCEAIQSLAAVIEQAAPCDPDVCVVSWDQPPPPPPPPPHRRAASSRHAEMRGGIPPHSLVNRATCIFSTRQRST